MSRALFGTDGIRGRANEWPMTVDVAMRLGQALAMQIRRGVLGRSGSPEHRARVVLGKDTRLSGYMIEQAIAAGLTSCGVDVMLVGPLPTPGIAFITESMRADAGVVVSASHNPFEDNGIKVFDHQGYKLPDDAEREIERSILGAVEPISRVPSVAIGKAVRIEDARGRYLQNLKNTFPRAITLDGLRVVLDCAHGAAYRVAPEVLRELGAEVIAVGTTPDGVNINAGVGSTHPELAQKLVVEHQAHIGVTLDGDADRVILVDERGQVIDGDALMAVCARELHARGALKNNTLVATVMSNVGLERCLKPLGITVERVQVGDRYVVERMREASLNLGGEQSGHMVFLDHATTGDGMVAALSFLAVMKKEGKKASDIAAIFQASPQKLVNLKVQKKVPIADLPEVQRVIADVESRLGTDGRVLVRYSGTEMKVRVMVEGPSDAVVAAEADAIKQALETALA